MRNRSLNIAYLIAVLLFTAIESKAQANPSLSTVLTTDGSVRSSISGSFDPTGYRMAYGPNGEPKFVSASQAAGTGCADSWDTSFTMSGTNISISTVVSDASGNVYIGGWFDSINGMPASGIAKWDGTTWSALGSGLSGPSGAGGVKAIAVSGTDVYVGGDFTFAGGAPALHVAKWNGTSWSAMGSGLGTSVGSQIEAIAVSGTNVYAGGQFLDGANLNYIARWDGSSWVSMGTGMNQIVRAIAVSGSVVYAGGSFSTAGGNAAQRMATWDGSTWSAMQAGSLSNVHSIAISGSDIYIGTTSGLNKWNGSGWTQLGTISNGASAESIRSIVVAGSDVYIGGEFTNAGGVPANRVAKYNGTSWSSLGTGIGDHFTHFVTGIAMSGGTLFTGGFFPVAGGVSAKNIATWNGSSWSSFSGTGLTGEVLAIAVSGTDVYVGGSFLGAGPLSANRIAKWNSITNAWSTLGTGVTTAGSTINTIAVVGNKVYAGGNFSSIGGVSANNIAVWNGATWARLGTSGSNGVDGPVFAIAPQGQNLYVGGSFLNAAGQPAWRIARWNGTAWSGLNSGIGIIAGSVGTIVPVGNDIYVGSSYTLVDGPNYFNKYDGTTWTALGAGMTGGGLNSLAYDGTSFYVAGGFTAVGGISAARIAKWNGSVWSALGSGVPGNPGGLFRIAMSGSDVIAVGDFLTTQGAPFNYVTKWNGSGWSALGNGLNGTASAVAVAGGDVFVGGLFTRAGCNTSPYFARWRETLWTGSTNTDWHTTTNWGGGSVPASNQGVTISTSDAAITSADVTVSSLVVTGGRTLTVGGGRTLTVTRSLDLSDGSISGSGALIVNGDLTINSGSLAGLSSLTVTGELNVRGGSVSVPGSVTAGRVNGLGGNLTAVTPIVVNGDLNLAGGTATATTSIAVGGNLNLLSGTATGGGAITVTGNAVLSGGAVSSLGSLTVNGNLSLTGGNASGVGSILLNGNLQLTTGKITGSGTVTISSCSPSAVSGGSSTSLIESPLVRCVNSSGTFIFPVGTGSAYSPVELSNVSGSGNFTVEPKAGPYSGAASGLPPNRLQRWWQLTNGGIAQADVVFNYVNADIIAGSEIRYRVYQISGGTATRVPSSVSISTNRATMLGATSFAAFTTAHTDSVPAMFAGRLTTASGRGAANQLIQILDEVGNPRFTVTNPFGYYRFPDTPTIRTYRLTIRSKRYGFPQGEIAIQFDDASSNINFVASDH